VLITVTYATNVGSRGRRETRLDNVQVGRSAERFALAKEVRLVPMNGVGDASADCIHGTSHPLQTVDGRLTYINLSVYELKLLMHPNKG